MCYLFTPPTGTDSPVLARPHFGNRLARHARPRPVGRNVWQLIDGTYSFNQPYPLFTAREAVEQAGTNNNIAATYMRVFYGGASHIVTDDEATAIGSFLSAEGFDPDDWLAVTECEGEHFIVTHDGVQIVTHDGEYEVVA